jgi:pimeloyl-ACP methyl ester carboxylesterase
MSVSSPRREPRGPASPVPHRVQPRRACLSQGARRPAAADARAGARRGDGAGDALQATVAALGDHVKGGAIEGCGHFLPEECPGELTAAILKNFHADV